MNESTRTAIAAIIDEAKVDGGLDTDLYLDRIERLLPHELSEGAQRNRRNVLSTLTWPSGWGGAVSHHTGSHLRVNGNLFELHPNGKATLSIRDFTSTRPNEEVHLGRLREQGLLLDHGGPSVSFPGGYLPLLRRGLRLVEAHQLNRSYPVHEDARYVLNRLDDSHPEGR